jgi:hypothetical protein
VYHQLTIGLHVEVERALSETMPPHFITIKVLYMKHGSLQPITIPGWEISITAAPGNDMQEPLTVLLFFVLPGFENFPCSLNLTPHLIADRSWQCLSNNNQH